jgi:hypothetical protein
MDGDELPASRHGHFTPTERVSGIHWMGGWVDPRAVLEAVVKRKIPSPHRDSNARTPMGEMRNSCKILVGKPTGRDNLEDQGVERILEKQSAKV